MATHRTTVNVSLTPELDAFLQSRVKSGRYQTTSEVVREALRLLERQERERDEAFQQLKAKLERGAAQAERGELLSPLATAKKKRAGIFTMLWLRILRPCVRLVSRSRNRTLLSIT
jgi:antitoxin ParD1/3/4